MKFWTHYDESGFCIDILEVKINDEAQMAILKLGDLGSDI